MVVTLDTAHFEISLLNAVASRNAVKIIYNNNTKREKEQKNKYQRERKLEIILVIQLVVIKWKTICVCVCKKNNKKRDKKRRVEIECYVLLRMVVTRDTAHFEISLLNLYANANAVQIIQ